MKCAAKIALKCVHSLPEFLSGGKGRGVAQRVLDRCQVLGNAAGGGIKAVSWCQGEEQSKLRR